MGTNTTAFKLSQMSNWACTHRCALVLWCDRADEQNLGTSIKTAGCWNYPFARAGFLVSRSIFIGLDLRSTTLTTLERASCLFSLLPAHRCTVYSCVKPISPLLKSPLRDGHAHEVSLRGFNLLGFCIDVISVGTIPERGAKLMRRPIMSAFRWADSYPHF
jgi:hypothetical protein